MKFRSMKDWFRKYSYPITPRRGITDDGSTFTITPRQETARKLMLEQEKKVRKETKQIPSELKDLDIVTKERLARKISTDIMAGLLTKEEVLEEINNGQFDNDPDARRLALHVQEQGLSDQIPETVMKIVTDRLKEARVRLETLEKRSDVDVDITSDFNNWEITYTMHDELLDTDISYTVNVSRDFEPEEFDWVAEQVNEKLGTKIPNLLSPSLTEEESTGAIISTEEPEQKKVFDAAMNELGEEYDELTGVDWAINFLEREEFAEAGNPEIFDKKKDKWVRLERDELEEMQERARQKRTT